MIVKRPRRRRVAALPAHEFVAAVDASSAEDRSLAALPGARLLVRPPGAQLGGVVVVGAHHSGTSAVAQMLARLGLFAGERADLLLDREGTKYWELADVVAANDALLPETGLPKYPVALLYLPLFSSSSSLSHFSGSSLS